MRRLVDNVTAFCAAGFGLAALIPAVSLVGAGVSGTPVSSSLTHPLLVFGGILAALITNLPRAAWFRPRNALVLLAAAGLGAIIAGAVVL